MPKVDRTNYNAVTGGNVGHARTRRLCVAPVMQSNGSELHSLLTLEAVKVRTSFTAYQWLSEACVRKRIRRYAREERGSEAEVRKRNMGPKNCRCQRRATALY